MPIVETKPKTLTNVVKRELWAEDGYCRKAAVIDADGVETYVVGTVLGVVTASGKYKRSLAAAIDGSETPAAIFMGAGPNFEPTLVTEAAGDESAVVLVQGPSIVGDDQLDIGTGLTIADVIAALEPKGINFDTQVKGALNNV